MSKTCEICRQWDDGEMVPYEASFAHYACLKAANRPMNRSEFEAPGKMTPELEAKLYAAVLYAITEAWCYGGEEYQSMGAAARANLASDIVATIRERGLMGEQASK